MLQISIALLMILSICSEANPSLLVPSFYDTEADLQSICRYGVQTPSLSTDKVRSIAARYYR